MFDLSQTGKRAYVLALRALAWPLRRSGLMARFGREGSTLRRRWLRSLFAIHDLDDMIDLDLAWWTYEAIDQVEQFLHKRPGARVFEYGSGASTLWLAKRAGSVVSVEHDDRWREMVSRRLEGREGVTLILRAPEQSTSEDPAYRSAKPGWKAVGFRAYATEIERHAGPFDLIVIDGRVRAACLVHAIDRLADDGMIVFDNSSRPRYQAALRAAGLAINRTRGLTPALPYAEETALLVPDRSNTPGAN